MIVIKSLLFILKYYNKTKVGESLSSRQAWAIQQVQGYREISCLKNKQKSVLDINHCVKQEKNTKEQNTRVNKAS